MQKELPQQINALRTLDFRVAQALKKVSSPPFLGLLEFSDENRSNAEKAIATICNGSEPEVARILSKFQNFTSWYLCDAVRRSYGSQGNARVWPDIAIALGVKGELTHPFRHALHDIVAQRCERLGLPVPTEDRVSLFRLHAGVSEAQLPALVRAFLAQERHFGMPHLDDGNALNEWEDNSLNFVPHSLSVLRMPILWDVSAWHASIYAECRLGKAKNKTEYHSKFEKIIETLQKERAASAVWLESEARPRLILDNDELSIKMPGGTSRQPLQFDDNATLRIKPGSIVPLPFPLPRKASFGERISAIDILPLPGDILVGDGDLEGDIIQVRRKFSLGMSNIIIFAREPIISLDNSNFVSHELADGLFTAATLLPQQGALKLIVGDTAVLLERLLYRRISLKGGVVGRGQNGVLYSAETKVLIRTGIASVMHREISVRLGSVPSKTIEFQTDASGEAEIPLTDIFTDFDEVSGTGVEPLRLELLRPRENEASPGVGSGVRLRADVWLDFLNRDGILLNCSKYPRNLRLEDSQNIFLDQNNIPCIDPEAISDTEIAFEVENKVRRYRLPPLDLNIVHLLTDGSTRPVPVGSSITLTSSNRGGALRIRSNDHDAELEIPGRNLFRPFQGGRTSTVSMRALGSGWVRLHKKDGVTIDLIELREEFAYRSVDIKKRPGTLQINVSLEGKIDAVRVEIERELGEFEIGDVYFGSEQYLAPVPDWVAATQPATGQLQVSIYEHCLLPGIWLGRLYVRDENGWHSVVAERGDLLAFVCSYGEPEPETIRTAERCERIIGWLDKCYAVESWQEGGVGPELTNCKSKLVKHLDGLPGGRSRLLNMSLSDDWFVAGATWMPAMQALFDCPEMFEGSITNFYNAGGAFEAFALLESQRLRELDFMDPMAFFGFSNVIQAQNTDEKLTGFNTTKLLQIISHQESLAEVRWNGKPILGPTHWRSAHILLQDRVEETGFFGDDAEGNNGRRSLKLRILHGAIARDHQIAPVAKTMPVPSFLLGAEKRIHEDFSKTLRAFSIAVRSSNGMKPWLSMLEAVTEQSRETILGSIGDLIRLAPELFAFHLIAAELERRS